MQKYLIHILIVIVMLLFPASTMAMLETGTGKDTTDTEYWRNLGYQARLKGLPDSSLYYYNKVLDLRGNDYDALLATARLYYQFWNLPMAIQRYGSIYKADNTDVEALTGMGLSYGRQGIYDTSIYYLEQALIYLPGHWPAMFGKARYLSFDGKLKEALQAYDDILALDNTWAEAWEGKGKMYYWMNRPVSALPCYKRALELDPGHPDYEKGVKRMKELTAWTPAYTFRQVMEDEQVYRVVANINQVSLSKRVSDHLAFSAGSMLDISDRTYIYDSLLDRRFDNSWLSLQLLYGNHSLNARVGYSFSDSVYSAYGLSWNAAFRIKKVRFWNSLGASYDYFYYWNRVSRDYFHDNLSITWKRLKFDNRFMKGTVREALVYSDTTFVSIENPFMLNRASLSYTIVEKPAIAAVMTYEWRSYNNRSPLYWSPYQRSLLSPGLKFSHEWKGLKWNGNINIGFDNYDVFNIDGGVNTSYDLGRFTFAAGYSGFYNEYYKNRVLYILLKARF